MTYLLLEKTFTLWFHSNLLWHCAQPKVLSIMSQCTQFLDGTLVYYWFISFRARIFSCRHVVYNFIVPYLANETNGHDTSYGIPILPMNAHEV